VLRCIILCLVIKFIKILLKRDKFRVLKRLRVGYVLSSNNLFTDDYETVKSLAGQFSGLMLEKTGKTTSLLTMLGFDAISTMK